MSEHPHLITVKRYYEGCSRGDGALIKSAVTPDVVHYFPLRDPLHGAEAVAAHWFDLYHRLGATWTVDHAILQGDEVALEWTMRFTPQGAIRPVLWRGAEWCLLRNGRICEIRAYYHHPVEPRITSELKDFPYRQRGYPVL